MSPRQLDPAPPQDALGAALYTAVGAFLDALDHGSDALEPWFTPDATMYFPFHNTQARLEGREAIVARFAKMNAQLRTTRAAGPYIGFGVKDFRHQLLAAPLAGGHGWVLVTALFTFADQWGRRTLLMRHDEGAGWRIHHLHASNMKAPEGAPR